MSKIQDLQEFTSLLDQGYTNEQLSAYYTCGVTTVKRFKSENRLNGYKTNAKPLSDKQLMEIEAFAESGKSLENIASLTGRTNYILKKYLPKELYSRIIVNSRNVFSRNLIKADVTQIFSPTANAAYICGVLQSDGFLTSDGYIGLTVKDRDLAEEFARFFKTGVREVVQDGKTYYACRFKDIRNLEKFKEVTNIYPRKTYDSYVIPNWIHTNDSFMYHFIAGVFDGDGWVSIVKNRESTVEIGIEQHRYSKKFLETINEYLGWSTYCTEDTFRIHTKCKDKTEKFYTWYSQIEYIMLRKVSVLDGIYL